MGEFEQERSRSSKVGQIIGIVICFILIVGLAFGYIFLSHITRQYNSDITKVEKDIKNTQDSIEMKQTEINGIKAQLNENINIEDYIDEQKEKYEELAYKLEQEIVVNDLDEKIAYLTFVDGPYKLTNKFLDILDEYDIKATFFCLNKNEQYDYDEDTIQIYDEIVQRIINNGHTLANGTTPNLINMAAEEIYETSNIFINAIKENRDYYKDNYNYTTSITRLIDNIDSVGEIKDELLEKLKKENYGYIEFNCDSFDEEDLIDSDQLISNVIDNTNNRKILVVKMHDYNTNSFEALPYIIDGLIDQGYTFLPLFKNSVMVKNN